MLEAKIRRIIVPAQLGEYACGRGFMRPYFNIKKKNACVCACHPNDCGKHKIGGP
jgi:hypothetical protein